MDAVAAVGLASNVVQFIEFGCKLFSTVTQINTSQRSLTDDFSTIQIITADLKQLFTDLKSSTSQNSIATQDRHIASLGAQCLLIAEKLLEAIAKLKPKRGKTRWGCFQAALKTVWKQDEIDRMTLQLNGLRMELMLRMQFTSQPETFVASNMKDVIHETRETRTRLTESIDDLRNKLSNISHQLQAHPHNNGTIGTSKDQDHDLTADNLPAYASQLVAASHREGYLLDLVRLVKSLHFEGSGYRHSKITAAHPRTFEWAYRHRYVQFLQSNEPFFWISGKPGSGKSTFMKFIVDNPQTGAYLKAWAGKRIMIASSYFFWINGSPTQRSQEGLLRSIALDVLLQCPELREIAIKYVKELDHSRWQTFGESTFLTSWDLPRLMKLVKLLTAESQAKYCLCLFIDGLDEYDGESESLADLLSGFRGFQNLKICVASRPWNQFESAFGTNRQQKLYMQELTHSDILVFVRDKLEHSPEFKRMKEESPGVEALISEITNRAQGVFLWVRLVVQSLLRGLSNADRIIDLHRRLAEYPQDLDDFFRYIMGSIDPIYHAQVAQGFRAVQTAPRTLSILQFWYLDHEDEDPDYPTKRTLVSVYAPEGLGELRRRDGRRAFNMNKRIVGRFKGFLEVTHEGTGRSYISEEGARMYEMKVDFLHRTVNDFLATKTCQDVMHSWTPVSFNVYRSLYKASFANLQDACARPECIINTSSLGALVGDLSNIRAASRAYTGDCLDDLFQELLTLSERPTPSYHGTSLVDLLGKSVFEEVGTCASRQLVLGEADRSDDAWRFSSNVTSIAEAFVNINQHDWLSTTWSTSSVSDRQSSKLRGHPKYSNCRRWGMPGQLSNRSRTQIPTPVPINQLVDERALARHLSKGSDVTADEIWYALKSGQLSRTFVRNLLDYVNEARGRQLRESDMDH